MFRPLVIWSLEMHFKTKYKQDLTGWKLRCKTLSAASLSQSDHCVSFQANMIGVCVASGPLCLTSLKPQRSLPFNGFQIQHARKSWKCTFKSIKSLRKGFKNPQDRLSLHSLSQQLISQCICGYEDINFSASPPQLFSLPIYIEIYADTPLLFSLLKAQFTPRFAIEPQ